MFFVVGSPSNDQILFLRKILKSLWFIRTHTNQIRKYRLNSFEKSSYGHRFMKDDKKEKENSSRLFSIINYGII